MRATHDVHIMARWYHTHRVDCVTRRSFLAALSRIRDGFRTVRASRRMRRGPRAYRPKPRGMESAVYAECPVSAWPTLHRYVELYALGESLYRCMHRGRTK